jgi:hypothetical protein
LQIYRLALFCFRLAPVFVAQIKKEESGKLLVVELFYYSNESVLISAGCDVVLLFSVKSGERKELYGFSVPCINED